MSRRREKVFISYSSKNDRFVREEILPEVKRAKRNHWFAPRSIGGGDDWRMKLLDGLETCQRLIVVVSQEALESGYVKDEVANAAKKLLAKHARLDARRVHRAILPVKIEERGKYGEKVASVVSNQQPGDGAAGGGRTSKTPVEVDPHLIHPYLTLVNFISIPHNEQLNRQLDQKTGKYLGDAKQLTRDQRRSIREYATERKEARKRLVTAIRNPDVLKRGFSRTARLIGLLGHANVQRVALAAGLLVAIFLLFQLPRNLLWPTNGRGDLSIDVMSEVKSSPAAESEAAFSVDLSDGPKPLLIRAKTNDDDEAFVRVLLRAELPQVDDAPAPGDNVPGTTPGDPPEIYIERVTYQARAGEAEQDVEVIPVAQEATYLRVRAQTRSGLEAMQYVKIEPDVDRSPPKVAPAGPAEIEIMTARQVAGRRVNGEITKLGANMAHIAMTNDPTALLIRANTKDSQGVWRYVRIHPPEVDPPAELGSPELEITRIREDGRVMESFVEPEGQVSVTDDPATFLRIVVKTASQPVIERKLRLSPEPIDPRIAKLDIAPISQRDRELQHAMAANKVQQYVSSFEKPTILRVVATTDSGAQSKRFVHVRTRAPAGPKKVPASMVIRTIGGRSPIERALTIPAGGRPPQIAIAPGRTRLNIEATATTGERIEREVNLLADLPESGPPRIRITPQDRRTLLQETGPNDSRVEVTRETRLIVQAVTEEGKTSEHFVTVVLPPRIEPEITLDTDPPRPRTNLRRIDDIRYSLQVAENTRLAVLSGGVVNKIVNLIPPPPPVVPNIEFRTNPPPPGTAIRHMGGTHYSMRLMQEKTDLGVFAGGKELSFTLIAPRNVPRVTFQTDPPPPATTFRQVDRNQYLLQLSMPTDLHVAVGGDTSVVRLIPFPVHQEDGPPIHRRPIPRRNPGPYEPAPVPVPAEGPYLESGEYSVPPVTVPPISAPAVGY